MATYMEERREEATTEADMAMDTEERREEADMAMDT